MDYNYRYMTHFSKKEEEHHLPWWNQELTMVERSDVKNTFALLEVEGTVKRGPMESTTANLKAVLDHLLTEKATYYQGKIDTKHDQTCHKYDQMYHVVYNQTRHGVLTPGTPWKTPSKIKMCRDDELNHTDTHSSK